MVTFTEMDTEFEKVPKTDLDFNGQEVVVGYELQPKPYVEELLEDGRLGYSEEPWFPFDVLFTRPTSTEVDPNVAKEHKRRHDALTKKSKRAGSRCVKKLESKLEEKKDIDYRADYMKKADLIPDLRGDFSHLGAPITSQQNEKPRRRRKRATRGRRQQSQNLSAQTRNQDSIDVGSLHNRLADAVRLTQQTGSNPTSSSSNSSSSFDSERRSSDIQEFLNLDEDDEEEREFDLLPQPGEQATTLAMLLANIEDNDCYVDRAAKARLGQVSERQARQEEANYKAQEAMRKPKKSLPRNPYIDDEAAENDNEIEEDGQHEQHEDDLLLVSQVDGQADSDSDCSTLQRPSKKAKLRIYSSDEEEPQQSMEQDGSQSPSSISTDSTHSLSSRTLGSGDSDLSDFGELDLDQSLPLPRQSPASSPRATRSPYRNWVLELNSDPLLDFAPVEREVDASTPLPSWSLTLEEVEETPGDQLLEPANDLEREPAQEAGEGKEIDEEEDEEYKKLLNEPGPFICPPTITAPGAGAEATGIVIDNEEMMAMSEPKEIHGCTTCNPEEVLCSHARFVHPTEPVDGMIPPKRDYANEPFQNKTMREFIKYVYRKRFTNYVFLSHFGSGFDSLLVLRQAIMMGIHCRFICKGRKVLSITFVDLNISFLDSFLFVSSSLRSIHSSLDLKCDSKGHFPFLMNNKQFYNVVISHLPPKHLYNPELMKPHDQEEFNEWYDDCVAKGQGFNFTQELIKYNQQDTMILFLAVRKLIASFLELSYNLWVNRLNQSTPFPCATTYYYDSEVHANDVDRSNGAFNHHHTWTQEDNPELPGKSFKVAMPYPPRRFNLEKNIRPCNIHVFSYITLPGKPIKLSVFALLYLPLISHCLQASYLLCSEPLNFPVMGLCLLQGMWTFVQRFATGQAKRKGSGCSG